MNLIRGYLVTRRCPIVHKSHVQFCMLIHTTVGDFVQDNLSKLLTSMPKVENARETLRHVRYRDKRAQGGQKMPAPSRIDVQVIGSGARGTPKSVLITTDYSRYLFNCGEGTQRIAQEHKMKLAKLENVFITYKSWDNMGGLLGLALTLEATNVPQITLHGPEGIEEVVQMAKTFNSQHSTIKLEKKDVHTDRFEDSAIAIDYVVLHRRLEAEKGPDAVGGSEMDNEGNVAKRPRLDASSDSQEYTVAYICQPHPPLRKLIIEKCVELGVPTGPLCGRLKEGETITLEDGTVITPDQVLSDREITRPIIVLECPSEEYVLPLRECGRFHCHQPGGDKPVPNLIVHMTPAHVMSSPNYQTWMNSFGTDTHHMVLNETTSTIMFEGVYRIQALLNLIDPRIFPLLPHQRDKENLPPDSNNITLGKTNLTYHYRPSKGFDSGQCIEVHKARFADAAKERSEVTEELEKLAAVKREATPVCSEVSFPEVIFLGTGSSIPSKVRNVSCILLQVQENRYVILDCGEGSLGQLYHHYGDHVDDVLENLEAIFVSHMHADHHLGMFGVLEARKRVLERRGKPHTPVLLLAPIQMTRWLKFYSQHIRQAHSFIRLVALQDLLPHKLEVTEAVYTDILDQLSLTELRPVTVDHCRNAFGVCLTHKDGWKLVYSGDTMPCNRLVEAGHGCDLLIHEATMEDELEEEAKTKTHSTTSQAIDVGVQMEAKFILLTHFSQRYSKIPVFSEKFSDKVGIAFDNMRVRLKEVTSLPLFTPAIKALFAEEYALLEERTFKRNLNKKKMTTTGRQAILELFKGEIGEKS